MTKHERDNSTALAEQELILDAISENEICASITAGSALGASLIAFNQIARKYGESELTPQEWVEKELPNALLARKRAWEYASKTRSEKAFAEEMRAITKLFTVPPSDHPKYMERMVARFEAEQNCRAKYGIQ